jgi:hypothetical protein
VDSVEDAKLLRETFVDRPSRHMRRLGNSAGFVGWPASIQLVGRCLSVSYESDKWQEVGDFEDYKHIAEAPQELWFAEGFELRDWWGKKILDTVGPRGRLPTPMPRHVAELSNLLNVQARFFEGTDAEPVLPRGDRGILHMDLSVPWSKLGGARLVGTGEPFLFVYTSNGVHCLITGSELDIELDGITG